MLSRPRLRGDRRLGVVAAEVPITVFTNFFKSVVTTSETTVSMIFDDGIAGGERLRTARS